MMDKPTEKLEFGKIRTLAVPLSSNNNDILFILVFRERRYPHQIDSKRFLHDVKISYKSKNIAKGIVDVNRFIVSLLSFGRNNFKNDDIYFMPTQDKGSKYLRCEFDNNRYISPIEAAQMYKIAQEALIGYSKAYLYDAFTVNKIDYKTEKEAAKYSKEALKNTQIVKD